MNGSGLAIFEASLICLGGYEMRELLLDPFKYYLLHDLGDVRPLYYRPDLVQPTGSLGEGLL